MKENRNTRSNRTSAEKQPVRPACSQTAALYNGEESTEDAMRAKEGFAERLYTLRTAANLSARKLSFLLGQASGYVSNIENGHNLPSMTQFFEICELLGVTPGEFFDYLSPEPENAAECAAVIRSLPERDRAILLAVAKRIGESNHENR